MTSTCSVAMSSSMGRWTRSCQLRLLGSCVCRCRHWRLPESMPRQSAHRRPTGRRSTHRRPTGRRSTHRRPTGRRSTGRRSRHSQSTHRRSTGCRSRHSQSTDRRPTHRRSTGRPPNRCQRRPRPLPVLPFSRLLHAPLAMASSSSPTRLSRCAHRGPHVPSRSRRARRSAASRRGPNRSCSSSPGCCSSPGPPSQAVGSRTISARWALGRGGSSTVRWPWLRLAWSGAS